MSEELITTEELNGYNEENKKIDTKKKSKKIEIIENFQYVAGEGEQLIIDKPSEPLVKNITSEQTKKDSLIMKIEKQQNTVKSNKELYESYIKELRYFSLSINGETIYDSSIDKSKDTPIKFDNDFFVLYGKKYSYNGLKIQKINAR